MKKSAYSNQPSILWHDYESWGATPKQDHPAQFAAIRTDLDLNPIDEPVEYFCYPPKDYLPHPQACLITSLTPQITQARGTNEHEFMRKVLEQMSVPQTCTAGYNSIRFDDELTRYSLYRNLFNPYAREWQNGNSRWDIIDMVRACYALRPEGIEWPEKEDGSPSFKLEALTVANELEHLNAHDAVSDVRATITMAKLIKTRQPKLYEFLFDLKNKRKVQELIDVNNATPLVHVSSKIPALQGCCTWIAPIAWHPNNNNAVIVLNLALDPSPLLDLSVAEIEQKLFSKKEDLAEGEQRLPIKLIHINKCPVLAPAKTLKPENAERLGIDRDQCLVHLNIIKQNPIIREKVVQLYENMAFDPATDADQMLYDGFLNDADSALCEQVQAMSIDQLAGASPAFQDARLKTLWFRFKARNYPEILTNDENQKWRLHCQERLTDLSGQHGLNVQSFADQLEQLATVHANDEHKMSILKQLYLYAESM